MSVAGFSIRSSISLDDNESKYASSETTLGGVPHVAWQQNGASSTKRSFWRGFTSSICTVPSLSLMMGLVALAVTIGTLPGRLMSLSSGAGAPKLLLSDCGSSWQEAEAKGCVFDVMATDWVRAECKDKELSDALFARGNWTFYRDSEATQVVPHEEPLKGRVSPYYTEGSYHFSHCAYTWHKHVRAMGKEQILLDSKSRDWMHSMHCLHMLVKAETSYMSNRTSSQTVLGQTKTGDSVGCIAGAWEPLDGSLAGALKATNFEH